MNDQTTPQDPSSDPWESEMTSEFDRRVRDLHEAPLTLEHVKGKAVTIQRTRRAAVAGGILAAAAVIVPVAVVAANTNGNDRADEIQVATASPTSGATDPVTTGPDPAPTTAPTAGAAPAYLEGSTFHRADGTESTLPGPDYLDAAALGVGQVAAYRTDDQGNGFVDLVAGDTVTTTYAVRSAMSTTPDGSAVAFVTTDDELLVVDDERGEQSFGDVEPGVTLSAIVGTGDCGDESGCHPFLEHSDFSKGDAYEINYEGPETAPAPGALRVNDGEGFLVSVITEVTDDSTCGGLYDREGGGRWIFETCDYQVHEISPAGDLTIGLPSYFDGLGPLSFAILDAEGRPVAEKSLDRGVVAQVGWLDETHAVATVYEGGAWKVVSLGVDGREEVLVEGAPGDEMSAPYRLTGLG